ncbi:MAG TPA: hypothetical protein VJ970_07225 [Flavobacteriaceae bacterium]|nr:hypothetical protein [Flavobacteriaceae bacterium]
MKTKLFILILFSLTSCKSQDVLKLNYKAQTRGYLLKINLNENLLHVEENGKTEEVKLTKSQLKKLNNELETIDFESLELKNLEAQHQVDRAIPATLQLVKNGETYTFEFTHNTNKKINTILTLLKSYTNLEE